jgi:rare lipoprotein A
MFIRHLLATCATLLLATAPLSHAQTAAASAPPAASAVAGAAKAAAAPTGEASEGKVAYYGAKFAGRKTASGERFNPNALTMAHKTLPFGTLVRVTNLKTNKSVVVRVNDRGPSTPDRIGDVSRGAAAKLRMLRTGVTLAKLEVVGQAKARAKAKSKHKHH